MCTLPSNGVPWDEGLGTTFIGLAAGALPAALPGLEARRAAEPDEVLESAMRRDPPDDPPLLTTSESELLNVEAAALSRLDSPRPLTRTGIAVLAFNADCAPMASDPPPSPDPPRDAVMDELVKVSGVADS